MNETSLTIRMKCAILANKVNASIVVPLNPIVEVSFYEIGGNVELQSGN